MARSTRTSFAALCLIAAVCCAFFFLNRCQPLVRNGFVYARAAENVIAHGYDPRPVVADSKLSYDKPIGFAWIASPFVALFGNHVGLMIVSLFGVVAYVFAVWRFTLAFDPFELSDKERAWVLVFAGLSPIVVYQGWSAHPDGLFAALFIGVFTLTHRMLERATVASVLVWTAAILCAVLLKNYGMILVPSAGLYLLWNARTWWGQPSRTRRMFLVDTAFVVLIAIVALGWTGHNALMRFEGEGGGVGQYGKGSWWVASRGTLVQVGIAIVLNLHVALIGLVSRTTFDKRMRAALVSFPIPYVLGLMLFPTTFYNMRYFVPVLPFVALLCVAGLRSFLPTTQRLVRFAFVGIAALLVIVFNVETVHARVDKWIPRLEVNWIGVPLSLLDNLRMPLHREEKAWLANLNARVETNGVVYLPDVNYYGDARQGVYERAGKIRSDIQTRYVSSRDFAPPEVRFWVQGWRRDRAILEKLGTVQDFGDGLVRIDAQR